MTSLSLFTFRHRRRKWQPTPVLCLENLRGGGAWWAGRTVGYDGSDLAAQRVYIYAHIYLAINVHMF